MPMLHRYLKFFGRRFFCAVLPVLGCCVTMGADDLSARWEGLRSEALKRAVAADCRPQRYVTRYLDEDGVWQIMKRSDPDADGTGYLNRFSADKLLFGPSIFEGPDVVTVNVVHPWWWKLTGDERTSVGVDLYNLFPAKMGVADLKGEYPPGIVERPEFSNGIWSVGHGVFGGMECMLWQPPAGYEGDVARILFYLFTVYPDNHEWITGFGACYMSAQYYPGFSEPAIRQLLVWHREDAPDEAERRRNEVFGSCQGNINPFVEYPALAEYIWGDRKEEGASGLDDPTGEDEDTSPLRARYTLTDRRINLKSAAVPADARWIADGSRVEAAFLEPSSLGAGIHELRFESEQCSGKVLIEIVP